MSEHRIKVENGKYTFVLREGWKLDILRHGEPWAQNVDCPKAIGTMMAELDAARVVVAAVRQLVVKHPSALDLDPGDLVRGALELHDRLVDDREAPSAWCGAAATSEPDANPERCPRCQFTPCRRMFQCSNRIGYISNARLAEIWSCAEKNDRDCVPTINVNSVDVMLLVAELQRRREHEQDQATYRAFRRIDTAETVEELVALMMSLAGKLSPADGEDANRRYYQRKAQLESQPSTGSKP